MPGGGFWALTPVPGGFSLCEAAKSLLHQTSTLSLEGPLERLIESCSDLFVIGGRDLA